MAHNLVLAPERTSWLIYDLGFRGRANHYAGALWFYELVQPGQVHASATITFTGTPTFSQYTTITLGTGTQAAILQHQNLIGDTAARLPDAFRS